ncbi:hypothetical protein V865_000817 [Kwoniella europaea PYCC6329]|uniref:DNA/RNA-binding protein Alba-like domain-containing protein n=1 Tax=Kwoniella europaea PYCC6329 TaxID=1423913 RepID=A0AAX4KAX0_9TREE
MVDPERNEDKGSSSRVQAQSAKQPSKPIDINPNEPYKMRITSGGSISSYVDFAINFLNNNPHTPLVLHTLPPPQPNQKNTEVEPSTTSKYSTTLLTCTTTISRLISVVEIIKRSYIEQLRSSSNDSKAKTKGKMRMSKGIWQYTESALYHPPVPDPGTVSEEGIAGEMNGLERVLKGKLRPKMTHHPYLTITLSTIPLGLEQKRNVTVQHTLVKAKNSKKNKKASKTSHDDEREEEGTLIEVDKKDDDNEDKKVVSEDKIQNRKDTKGVKRSSDTEDQNKIGKKRKITKSSKGTVSVKI